MLLILKIRWITYLPNTAEMQSHVWRIVIARCSDGNNKPMPTAGVGRHIGLYNIDAR